MRRISPLLLLILVFPFSLVSQGKTPSAPASEYEEFGLDYGADAGKIDDERFVVKNVTFTPRFKNNGKGEVLDVIFDVENQTIDPVELGYSVVAFYEIDFVDKNARELVPYPSWREFDEDKDRNRVLFATLSPVHFNEKEEYEKIWKLKLEEDYNTCLAAKATENACKFGRAKATKQIKLGDKFYPPPMWDMLNYIQENFQKFQQKITVPGIMGLPTPAQVLLDKNNVELGKVFYSRTKATVISSHESSYRPDFQFFNKAAVLIFEPGNGKVLYRRIYKFTGRFKKQ